MSAAKLPLQTSLWHKEVMNILFLGDIVCHPGRDALKKHLPTLREKYGLDAVIANGENAASNGRGLTQGDAQEILNAGVDIITLGDHAFDQKGTEDWLGTNPKIIRPANYPPGTVGRGAITFTTRSGKRITVVNLLGRVFIKTLLDCPFQTSKRLWEDHILGQTCDALIVDFHAEATSEKTVMGHFWDGKASLVVGTHTHAPTNDCYIRPGGTAYQSDAGMCGDYNSSIGITYASALPLFTTGRPTKFEQAKGEATLCGTLLKVDATGRATSVQPVRVGGILGA